MNTKRVLATILVLSVLAGLLVSATLAQEGLPGPGGVTAGSPITYQGHLTDGGSPANGTYDFQFSLWDDPNTGSQVDAVTIDDQTVTDGLFTVKLDFDDVFDGTALWLEIGVRAGSSSGAYTPLSPRQPLNAAPYAHYAYSFPDHDHWGQSWSGSGAGLTLNSSDDDGLVIDSAGVDGVAVGSAGDDGVWVGSAGLEGVSVWSAGANGVHVYSAGLEGVQVNSAGNNGVFVGSAGADGVHVSSAGGNGVSVWSAGSDGVYVYEAGSPTHSYVSPLHNGLEVAGAEGHGLYVGQADDDGVHVYETGGDGVQVSSAGDDGVHVYKAGNPSADQDSTDKNGFEVEGAEGNGLFVGRADADGVHVESAGGDGVHATGGSDDGDYGGWFRGYTGVYGKGTGSSGYGGHFESDNSHGIYVKGGSGGAADGVHVESAGRDGVHVESATGYGVYVNSAGLDGIRVESAGAHGVYAVTIGSDTSVYGGYFQGYNGVYGKGTGTNGYGGHFISDHNHGIYVQGGTGGTDDGIRVESAGGDGVHVESASHDGVYAIGGSDAGEYGGYFQGYRGIYGYGTGTGTDGYGGYFESDHGHGVYVISTGTDDDGVHVWSAGRDGVHATGGSDAGEYGGWFKGYRGVYGEGTGTGVDSGYGGYFYSNAYRGVYASSASGYYAGYFDNRGGSGQPGLYVDGNFVATGSKSGYVVDIAINEGPEPLETGDVVVITGFDEPVAGEIPVLRVRKATEAGSTAVAGVVDQPFVVQAPQAGEEKPIPKPARAAAHVADGTAIGPGEYLSIVTLGSFKAIKVDASYGAIRVGDLLVSSPNPGYAMRAEDPRVGALVGKAMGTLDEGTGVIPVLVALQ